MKEHPEHTGFLGDRFDAFEYTPHKRVWGRIEEELNDNRKAGFLAGKFAGAAYPPSKEAWAGVKKTLKPAASFRYLYWAAAAASIALLIFFGSRMYFNEGKGDPQIQLTEVAPDTTQPNNILKDTEVSGNTDLAEKASEISIDKDPLPNPNKLAAPQFDPNRILAQQTTPISPSTQTPEVLPDIQSEPQLSILGIAGAGVGIPYGTPRDRQEVPLDQYLIPDTDDEWLVIEDDNKKFELAYEPGLSLNAGPAGIGRGLRSDLEGFANSDPTSTADLPDELLSSIRNEVYSLPIMVGANLNFRIRKRWSLGAGLVYTRLNSRAQFSPDSVEMRSRDYLGVAISSNYDIVQRKRFSLYATGGLQYDFGLIGQRRMEGRVISGPIGNQASANAGLGVNFQLLSFMSLYGQASAAHYFYQEEYNFWSGRPIWPSAQVGIRFNL